MRTMHLFAGAGGGLYADLILGHQPVVAVEWDAYACAVLRERAADGWFPGLHVHEGDVRLFDPSPWAGRVDCLHAGFPCQDVSVAGNQAGLDGERSGLYREVLRVADVLRPRFVFLENSPAIVGCGLGRVLGDLAARRFDARWIVLAAGDVGAPHLRERWWLLADALGLDQSAIAGIDDREALVGAGARASGGVGGRHPASGVPLGLGAQPQRAALGDADGEGQLQPEGCEQEGRGRPGHAGWWVSEPDLGRVAYGVAAGSHRMHVLGNGQVPLAAATAWRLLAGAIGRGGES